MNKVIARFTDGQIIKGITTDFFAGKELFHVAAENAPAGSKPVEVSTKGMKALFFVKDFAGNPQHVDLNDFDPAAPAAGRRIKVVFSDGEVLVGTTTGYQPGRPGFFLVPADLTSNNDRCYIITESTKEITFI